MSRTPIDLSVAGGEVPADVRQFCERHGLSHHLQTAMSLVKRHFAPVQAWTFSLEQEPENGDESAVISVGVRDTGGPLLPRYDAFLSDWVRAVPWPERDRIRLSYYAS